MRCRIVNLLQGVWLDKGERDWQWAVGHVWLCSGPADRVRHGRRFSAATQAFAVISRHRRCRVACGGNSAALGQHCSLDEIEWVGLNGSQQAVCASDRLWEQRVSIVPWRQWKSAPRPVDVSCDVLDIFKQHCADHRLSDGAVAAATTAAAAGVATSETLSLHSLQIRHCGTLEAGTHTAHGTTPVS